MQDRRFLRVLISLPYIPQAQIIRIINYAKCQIK